MDEKNGKSSLIYLDTASKEYKTLKSVEFEQSPIVFGTNRNAEYGRMQPYLYNLDKQLAYQYDDSVLYLSQAGILWVEYLKPEDEIGVGTIFNAENSRMRFLAFKEMREK